ncbi:MAG TPA: hypothetical protein VLJ85_00100, partial [Geodermatophilus sp.]|nr:hypothetical protein [Geodermatophilus sp.]
PADSGLPGITANVTVTAALDALEGTATTPGSVNGLPITAAHVRELLARLGALALRAPEGGSLTLAVTDPDGRLRATTTPDRLARLARRGCRQHPDRDCGCPVLQKPAPTEAYTPTAAQHAFVTTRDRACRFPTADSGWAGPTATTSSRTTAAGPPTAPTCAACAAPTTG